MEILFLVNGKANFDTKKDDTFFSLYHLVKIEYDIVQGTTIFYMDSEKNNCFKYYINNDYYFLNLENSLINGFDLVVTNKDTLLKISYDYNNQIYIINNIKNNSKTSNDFELFPNILGLLHYLILK